MEHNLALEFYQKLQEDPRRTALVVDGTPYDYEQLGSFAGKVAAWLRAAAGPKNEFRVGILAARSLEAVGGILGTVWAGHTYVPFNIKTPEDRLVTLLKRVPLDALIIDKNGAACITKAMRDFLPKKVLAPCGSIEIEELSISKASELNAMEPLREPVRVSGEIPAYLLFTSGTTGPPKAVIVTVANVAAYLRGIRTFYQFTPEDRFSQFSEISFDFSVHEMFVAWGAGASLWIVPEAQRVAPSQFIRENEITVWSSVPSVVSVLQQLRILRDAIFPSIRFTLFSGDALSTLTAQTWQMAAPQSKVDNHFGATELTVMCTFERYSPGADADGRGFVPIGIPYPEMQAAVVLSDGSFASPGEEGELAFSGPQITPGYLDEPELTARRYPVKKHPVYGVGRWYLTGDRGVEGANGKLHHLGRVDNQVKIRGYRVELEDVESHLREVTGSDLVSVLPWPIQDGIAVGLIAFVTNCSLTDSAVKAGMTRRLPAYMVPKRILRMDTLPLSANGKVDRKRLRELLDEQA
ncbi:MAG: amino acid adenylation domain-containing protein [Candidatus Krumholzibacteria bacterium]|nr:amino acid adenylation domain-containing protein [Candidatus Krumholzibacteria bacterium]